MPTAAGVPIFEDVVALLQSKPNPLSLMQHMDIITAGLADLANRVKNLEHGVLQNAHGVSDLQQKVAAHETVVRSLDADRTTVTGRLDALEKAPIDNTKRLDAVDARIRTVEGAVGSTGFKDASKLVADKPSIFTGVKPTDPVTVVT